MNALSNSGHVSASYVNLLFDWLDHARPDVSQRLPFARPAAGDLMRVIVLQWQAMLDWTYQQLEDPAMPLKLAAHVRPANMGLLGYVASCCNNLGEAFARLQQFENLVYSVNSLQVNFSEDQLLLQWGAERGKPVFLACALCHGRDVISSGSPGPDLRESALALDKAAFLQVVKGGALLEKGMPRYDWLSEDQAVDVWHYVRQQARAAKAKTGG